MEKVFYFYSKLFNTISNTSKLASYGIKDWKNMSSKLRSHETSNAYIVNMIENDTVFAKEIAFEMNIEPKFCERRVIRRKK